MSKTLASPPGPSTRPGGATLLERYRAVRSASEALAAGLAPEDMVPQSMADASPTKWHLAHTTWFFETFVLTPALRDYRSPDPQFAYLFNSYYNAVGAQYHRPHRGLVTRPTVAEVRRYRASVDERVIELLEGGARVPHDVVELGLNHEQQHQELLVTDLKHLFSHNPLFPIYRARTGQPVAAAPSLDWSDFQPGVREIGHDGAGFAFDNEGPRHKVYVHAFRLANRLVTCGEYRAFMADGGYERPELWLSDGWGTVREQRWRAPLYWTERDGEWHHYTLAGLRAVEEAEPVCHVSYFEADAYARWAGSRLPTEAEWEVSAADARVSGNLVEEGHFHPIAAPGGAGAPSQLFGDVWEWTQSAYLAYPGYHPARGALGEYNGKFMCNQVVLRGGSCATPRSHVRATYRNFFPPSARWQFSGIRLAADA